jgi:hypothetical protein
MNISEDELRAMVRDAITRQASAGIAPARMPPGDGPHPSHLKLALVGGGDADGRCLIEPTVACTHCGYCQSMGH